MSIFGPRYSASVELQRAVNHAERASVTVSRMAAEAQSTAVEDAERHHWVIGRADEIVLFVEDVVGDWRQGRAAGECAAAIESFLDEHVHEPIRAMREISPECCLTALVPTSARMLTFLEQKRGSDLFEEVLVVTATRVDSVTEIVSPAFELDEHEQPTRVGPIPPEPTAEAIDRLSDWSRARDAEHKERGGRFG